VTKGLNLLRPNNTKGGVRRIGGPDEKWATIKLEIGSYKEREKFREVDEAATNLSRVRRILQKE